MGRTPSDGSTHRLNWRTHSSALRSPALCLTFFRILENHTNKQSMGKSGCRIWARHYLHEGVPASEAHDSCWCHEAAGKVFLWQSGRVTDTRRSSEHSDGIKSNACWGSYLAPASPAQLLRLIAWWWKKVKKVAEINYSAANNGQTKSPTMIVACGSREWTWIWRECSHRWSTPSMENISAWRLGSKRLFRGIESMLLIISIRTMIHDLKNSCL